MIEQKSQIQLKWHVSAQYQIITGTVPQPVVAEFVQTLRP